MLFKISILKGLSFGIASGIITTLGMMVGLYSGTSSKLAVLGGIITIAVADAFSDAFGIHISEKASTAAERAEIWESTFATFFAKLLFALMFAIPVLLFDLKTAILVSIAWGILLLGLISIMIAKWRKESVFRMVAEHWIMAIVVVLITYYIGQAVAVYFPS